MSSLAASITHVNDPETLVILKITDEKMLPGLLVGCHGNNMQKVVSGGFVLSFFTFWRTVDFETLCCLDS